MKFIESLNLWKRNIDCSSNFKRSKGSACIVVAPCAKPTHLGRVTLTSHWGHWLACHRCWLTEEARIAWLVIETSSISRKSHTYRDIWIWLQLACEASPALGVIWSLNGIACISSSHLASPGREARGIIKAICRGILLSKVDTVDRTVLIWIATLYIYFLNSSSIDEDLRGTEICWVLI